MDSFFEKRFSKDYIDKLTTLLYNSRNKKDYSIKRKNLKQTIFKLDENERFYLTLPKLIINKDNKKGFANKQEIIGTNYTKTETTEYTNNKLMSTEKDNKDNNFYKKEENPLDENIKEIFYDQDIMDKEEEEKGKFLYEKLKTRYNNFDINNSSRKSNSNKKGRKNLSKIKKRNIPSDYQLIATPEQISEFDYYLGQAFKKGNFRFLTNRQKENLGYIGELNLFHSMNRIKEKQNMIKEMKNDKKNGKKILLPIDVFKYNAEKWKKYSYEKNRNNNDVVINELNEKNKNKLDDMKEYINKLNTEAYSADKDVNNIINNIDIFLDKYGTEKNENITRKNSRASEFSMKTVRNKKNMRDSKFNKEEEGEKKEELKLSL